MKMSRDKILPDVIMSLVCIAIIVTAMIFRVDSGVAGILAIGAPIAFIVLVVLLNNIVDAVKNKKI